jgi:cytidylate kinase
VGKSTICKIVAESLGYSFINTGEMYRALAWKVLSDGVNPLDEAAVGSMPKKLSWDFRRTDGAAIKTYLCGELMDNRIFSEEVSRTSSQIAKYHEVRDFMKAEQRRLGRDGGILMEGRDIGTAVFPDAELKIYLDAAPEARATRRFEQLKGKGMPADYDEILRGIISRDKNDAGRLIAPLMKAQDCVYIDTTDKTIAQVTDGILTLAKEKCSLM